MQKCLGPRGFVPSRSIINSNWMPTLGKILLGEVGGYPKGVGNLWDFRVTLPRIVFSYQPWPPFGYTNSWYKSVKWIAFCWLFLRPSCSGSTLPRSGRALQKGWQWWGQGGGIKEELVKKTNSYSRSSSFVQWQHSTVERAQTLVQILPLTSYAALCNSLRFLGPSFSLL